jgi:hypothetical protein
MTKKGENWGLNWMLNGHWKLDVHRRLLMVILADVDGPAGIKVSSFPLLSSSFCVFAVSLMMEMAA